MEKTRGRPTVHGRHCLFLRHLLRLQFIDALDLPRRRDASGLVANRLSVECVVHAAERLALKEAEVGEGLLVLRVDEPLAELHDARADLRLQLPDRNRRVEGVRLVAGEAEVPVAPLADALHRDGRTLAQFILVKALDQVLLLLLLLLLVLLLVSVRVVHCLGRGLPRLHRALGFALREPKLVGDASLEVLHGLVHLDVLQLLGLDLLESLVRCVQVLGLVHVLLDPAQVLLLEPVHHLHGDGVGGLARACQPRLHQLADRVRLRDQVLVLLPNVLCGLEPGLVLLLLELLDLLADLDLGLLGCGAEAVDAEDGGHRLGLVRLAQTVSWLTPLPLVVALIGGGFRDDGVE